MKKKKLNKYIVNKLNKIMLKSYPVSFEDMTEEHWELGRNNLKELNMNKCIECDYSKYADVNLGNK